MLKVQYAVHIGPADEHLVAVFTPHGPWAWDVEQLRVGAFDIWDQTPLTDDTIKRLRANGKVFWKGTLEGSDAKDRWIQKYHAWPLIWR